LLDAGYEVIAPAYRGCAGYGPEHLAANRGEWGRGDVADVTAAANDWKQQHKDRPLVLAGYSYGGYLTLLALARHDAPWDAGITLWGMVSIQQPLLAMLEATLPTDTLARKHALAERAPLDQATAIARPLLILHGALDGAATIEEVNSLHGRISQSELIIYPNDGHGLFLNRPDMLQQLNAFIERTPR
jgi:dipeptidyl aminopeptidase/acylaminoacyl peptidase